MSRHDVPRLMPGAQIRGGGVVFGPVVRSHAHGLQKKVRRLGLKCALSVRGRPACREFLPAGVVHVQGPWPSARTRMYKVTGSRSAGRFTGPKHRRSYTCESAMCVTAKRTPACLREPQRAHVRPRRRRGGCTCWTLWRWRPARRCRLRCLFLTCACNSARLDALAQPEQRPARHTA